MRKKLRAKDRDGGIQLITDLGFRRSREESHQQGSVANWVQKWEHAVMGTAVFGQWGLILEL